MNRKELVKDAIAHRATERVPYCISFTRPARARFEREVGCSSSDEYLDNDIIQIHPPWWGWNNLGPEWRGMSARGDREFPGTDRRREERVVSISGGGCPVLKKGKET